MSGPLGWDDPRAAEDEVPFATVVFDGLPFPVRQGLGYANLASFGQKFVIGDPTEADDPLLSLWVITDTSGGGQIDRIRPGSDQGRFRRSSLHTRDPNMTTLGRYVDAYSPGGTGNSWPMGDLSGTYYHAVDKQIYSHDSVNNELDVVAAGVLAEHPVNTSFEFGLTGAGSTPVLWVPHGSLGYSTFNGTTDTFNAAGIQPVAFAEWDDQLWCVTADCTLHLLTEGTGAWVQQCQFDKRHTPRNLLVYPNTIDEPTLHVITNRTVLAYSHGQRRFYPAQGWKNLHPDGGLGSDVSDAIHYSAGMGVRDYRPGGEVSPGGLDRGNGVPAEQRGRIVGLAMAQDELWALVEGRSTVTGTEQFLTQTGPGDEPSGFAAGTVYTSVHFRTIAGWHEAWSSGDATGTPTKIAVSTAGSGLRIWWGHGAVAYSVALPTDQHNPLTGLTVGADRFQASGAHQTGWFDAGMVGFDKIASHLQVNIPPDPVGATATETVTVRYRVDGAADFTHLGTLSAPGRRILPFGAAPDYLGVAFGEIELEWSMARGGTVTTSPAVKAVALHFLKNPHPRDSFTIHVPLDFDAALWDYDPGEGRSRGAVEIRQDLEALLTKRGLVKMEWGRYAWRVRLAQVTGSDATGRDERGSRLVSVVEVPIDQDEVLS